MNCVKPRGREFGCHLVAFDADNTGAGIAPLILCAERAGSAANVYDDSRAQRNSFEQVGVETVRILHGWFPSGVGTIYVGR